jgi:hypothetical protein
MAVDIVAALAKGEDVKNVMPEEHGYNLHDFKGNQYFVQFGLSVSGPHRLDRLKGPVPTSTGTSRRTTGTGKRDPVVGIVIPIMI